MTARTSSRLLASGKISSARPVMSPSKIWCTGDELGVLALGDQFDGLRAADQTDARNGQQHLLPDHLAKARRGVTDPHVHELGQGVELKLVEDSGGGRDHRDADARRASASARNDFSAASVIGFGRNCAPTSRARLTTSCCTLAETTAQGMSG